MCITNHSNSVITYKQLSGILNPVVHISVIIDSQFAVHVHVKGHFVNDHSVLRDIIDVPYDSSDKIKNLLLLSKTVICPGVTNKRLLNLDYASRRSDIKLESESVWRSDTCDLLQFDRKQCKACRNLSIRLSMNSLRRKTCPKLSQGEDLTKFKKPNKFLSTSVKSAKLLLLARKSKMMKKSISSLQLQLKFQKTEVQ